MLKFKQQVLKHRDVIEKCYIVINIVVLVYVSLYNFDYKVWAWQNPNRSVAIINVLVSFSGIFGILANYFFSKHYKIAYLLSLINIIFFICFAFYNYLIIDGLINLFIYIPILIFNFHKTYIRKKIVFEYFVSGVHTWTFFGMIFIILSIAFYFLNPQVTYLYNITFGFDPVQNAFGTFYKYKLDGNILLSMINSLSVVALMMLSLGFRENWYVWIVKNIISFVFFGGVGFFSIVVILLNAVYMNMSLFYFYVTSRKQEVRVKLQTEANSVLSAHMAASLKENGYVIYDKIEVANKLSYADAKKLLKESIYQFKPTYGNMKNIILWDMKSLLHTIESRIVLDSKISKLKWAFRKKIYQLSILLRPKMDYTTNIEKLPHLLTSFDHSYTYN
ncbi:nicotinamide mononucleotide transporter [Mycoplasma sp. 6243]|uniref:nicotinamide mononucleotide transporter n=1 Tax=Mycoplasma sp. 6243 TaxID=3440865 RepID=UPI003EB9C8E9